MLKEKKEAYYEIYKNLTDFCEIENNYFIVFKSKLFR